MRRWWTPIVLLLSLVLSSSAQEFYGPRATCEAVTEAAVYGPIDPQFSQNACIIIAEYAPIDCSRAPPDRFVNETGPNPCPGYQDLENTDQGVQLPYQVQYTQLEDALDNCPYDPVLIEFTGTLYLTNDPYFWYNQTKDLIIRGIPFELSTGGDIVQQLIPTNVTYFNSTTNTTYVVEELVATNVTTPIVNVTQQSTIVGFKNFQVKHQNISLTLDVWVAEGCGTMESVFLTLACPRQCILPEPPIICEGFYFREDDAELILNSGTCQRTGAYFDGYRFIRATNTVGPWHLQTEATIEAWVRPDELGEMLRHAGIAVVSYHHDDNDDGSFGFGLVWADRESDEGNSQIVFNAGNDGAFGRPLTGDAPRGQWTHIAGVWNNGIVSLYVNGELIDTKTRSDNNMDYSDTDNDRNRYGLTIGRAYTETDGGEWRYFNGTIDEVRLWNVARTQSQIRFAMRQTVDPLDPTLIGYWRFDIPIGAEPDDYPDNLVATYQVLPDFTTDFFLGPGAVEATGYNGPPVPYPDCFCENPDGLCTATDLFQEAPYEAILTDFGDVCTESENCTFVHGMVIDPNGQYGILWLPGLVEISGPSFNETTRFIPGRFEQYPVYENITVYNATLNITYSEVVQTNTTGPIFVPGAVPSGLPPVGEGYTNPYAAYDYFMPGWFANDGYAPYWAGNFYPGIFVTPEEANSTYNVPLPCGWEEGDLVFILGITSENDTFSPITPLDPSYTEVYITPHCGFVFNFTRDTEPCIIPTGPEIVEEELVPLEDEFGCFQIPGQADPDYLDPSARSPCSILAEIRALLPAGTESLAAEEVLGCDIGPDTVEPEYLDPSQRSPCFVLRDLRNQVTSNDTFALNCTRAGGYVQEDQYMPCLKNQNLTMFGMVVQNYYGDTVVCQHACADKVTLDVEYSQFKNTPGNAIRSSGLEHFDVHDNLFCPCGGQTDSCVYLHANHRTQGYFTFYNNLHCFDVDRIGPSCNYDIATTIRCQEGVLYCLDRYQTIVNGCPVRAIINDKIIFESDCSIFKPCEFPTSTVNVTLPNNVVTEFNTTGGQIVIEVSFLTPVITELTGGNTTFVIECQEETYLQEFVYEDLVPVMNETCFNNTGPFLNETFCNSTTIFVMQNLTTSVNITRCANATLQLTCPCPAGYIPGLNYTEGGAGGLGSTGLYDTCEWDLPGGLPGEFCLDKVVYCPYSGGTLGDGTPPPVPVGLCDGGTAVVPCNNATCLNGTLYYEGVYHPCNLTACNATGYATVPCQCASTVTDAGYLTIPCDRTTCIGTPCTFNATLPYNGTRCALYDGQLSWDGGLYPCVILENDTLCVGASYVPSQPPPVDGLTVIPCDNNYVTPGPGPCSCVLNDDIGGNTTVVGNSTSPTTGYYGDPALQLICLADGTLQCSCSGIYANNVTLVSNATLNPNSAAYHIDHIPPDAALWFQQNNVAQGLPYGWRFERFGKEHYGGWDLIQKFALKVPHFFTQYSIIYESRRLSPRITGLVANWVDGHPNQWSLVQCVEDPMADNCTLTQIRPLPATPTCVTPDPIRAPCAACIVNQDYSESVDGFDVYRFQRIQRAINQCAYANVIVQQASNVYEERLVIKRDNFLLISYDNAVLVNSNHRIVGDDITVRGFVLTHPNTNDYPIFVPAAASADFDIIQDAIETDQPGPDDKTNGFQLLNNEIVGDGANDVGVVIGQMGSRFKLNYNLIRNFFVRTVDIQAGERLEVTLNTFKELTGRAFRGRQLYSYIFERNLFQECIGVSAANEVEIVSLESYVVASAIPVPVEGAGFEALFSLLLGQPFDLAALEEAINPLVEDPMVDMGCNELFDHDRICYFRGNRQAVTRDQPDRSTVVYHIYRGAIGLDRIQDNMATDGFIGMKFVETPFITFSSRSELFKRNALIRVADTRKINDNPYDFGFQAPGLLLTIGCAFPDCLSINETYPNMVVNPMHDFIISDRYGFEVINNVTACNVYHLPLTTYCNITSGQARVRREDIMFFKDMHAIGHRDYPCCDRPVIEGHHVILSDVTALETVEWWFLFPLASYQPGYDLFATLQEFNAYLIFFNDCYFDGRYYLYEERVNVMMIFMREEDGDFSVVNSRFYNWWHFPEGTQLGYILDESERGLVPLVVLPNGDVFKHQRSPDLDGILVNFQSYQRIDLNPFIIPHSTDSEQDPLLDEALSQALGGGPAAEEFVTTRDGRVRPPVQPPTGDEINSYFGLEDCYFENFDGNAVRVRSPGNMFVARNVFFGCGMRQYEEIALSEFEMNPDSVGDYIWEDNYYITYKPFLFPFGGGEDNMVRFAAIFIHESGRPRRWKMFNNTVVVVENCSNFSVTIPTATPFGHVATLGPGEDNPTSLDDLLGITGLLSDPANIGSITNEDITPFTTTSEEILGTNLKPVLSQNGFVTEENSRVIGTVGESAIYAGGRNSYSVDPTQCGATVGLRLSSIDGDTIAKTQTPRLHLNYTDFYFSQEELYYFRLLVAEFNGPNTTFALAYGNYTVDQIPTNGPGIQGINADMIYCSPQSDSLDGEWAECTVCDDGCPIIPPDSCIVDPENDTFVPENPYYNLWLFSSLDDAVLLCKDSRRLIEVRRQDVFPYTVQWNLRGGNWTIFSQDGAVVRVNQDSILLNAHNLAFQNITFLHYTSNTRPTVAVGTAIGGVAYNITFTNCTFDGRETRAPAISGTYGTLAIEDTNFIDYCGSTVVNIRSDCGMLSFEGNYFKDCFGSALYASDYDLAIVQDNEFDECGGKFENAPACVYLSMCLETMVELVFSQNRHFQDTVDFPRFDPYDSYVAAYWIDGIPADDVVTVDISGNQATGLPVGMRVTNMEDRANAPAHTYSDLYYAQDYRRNPLWVYAVQRNVLVTGTQYNVWIVDPIDDDLVRDSPNTYKQRWCNEDCVASAQSRSQQFIIIFVFIIIVVGYGAITWIFRSAYSPQKQMTYSYAAGGYIPIESTKIPAFAAAHGVDTRVDKDYPGSAAPFGGPAEYRLARESII